MGRALRHLDAFHHALHHPRHVHPFHDIFIFSQRLKVDEQLHLVVERKVFDVLLRVFFKPRQFIGAVATDVVFVVFVGGGILHGFRFHHHAVVQADDRSLRVIFFLIGDAGSCQKTHHDSCQ